MNAADYHMCHYYDSSALVKLYVEEQGSSRIEELVESAPAGTKVVSRLTIVEVTSALVRRSRGGDYSDEHVAQVLHLLEEDMASFQVIELGGAVMSRAISLVRKHGLRAADAIQLASALLGRGESGLQARLVLVSSDQDLNAAARQEQLEILDPTAV